MNALIVYKGNGQIESWHEDLAVLGDNRSYKKVLAAIRVDAY